MEFFATAPKGTEAALKAELAERGFQGVRAERGGVRFEGSIEEGWRACLWSRVAVRILTPVARFECPNEAALYEGVAAHDFSDVLGPSQTLLVSAAARSSALTHTQYISQRTKDAVVDRLRERFGARPSVDRDDPDVQLFVHLVRDFATVYLDLSGAPLFLRGYRKDHGAAPLKENLAAAVLRLSGFDPAEPVLDPACGSGTLLIEAALWAENRAPGLTRERFGFERWNDFDAAARRRFDDLRAAARAEIRAQTPRCAGSDVDDSVLQAARANAARAGVALELRLERLSAARPDAPGGLVVTNPPYGERLERRPEQPRELARLVDRFPDAHVGLLLKEGEPLARTRRKPRLFPLFNGDIPCALRTYAPLERGPRGEP